MNKSWFKIVIVALASMMVVACGELVEVPPAAVGKISGPNGYQEGIRTTSKFRLPVCWTNCDKLVVLNVADMSAKESLNLFMPKDKLIMDFDLHLTLSPKPSDYDGLFDKLSVANVNDSIGNISITSAYSTYASDIIRTEAREILSIYSIAEVASNLEAINLELTQKLTKTITEKTPFNVRYIGLGKVTYPSVIIDAQVSAAERREAIQKEEAQLEISKVSLERQLQEQQLQRAIDVEKAEAEAEVNKILADSVTPAYIKYKQLEALQVIANSENTKFLPVEMLGSMASEIMVTQ